MWDNLQDASTLVYKQDCKLSAHNISTAKEMMKHWFTLWEVQDIMYTTSKCNIIFYFKQLH